MNFDRLLLGMTDDLFMALCRRPDLSGVPEDALGAEFEVRPTKGVLQQSANIKAYFMASLAGSMVKSNALSSLVVK